jgi:glycosyltransferase involved in cell wall biosynthesis
MVLAEALARGLPIVSTTAGAIPDTVPAAAGRLVPPGDADALAAALRAVLTDQDLYQDLKRGAAGARRCLPDWTAATRLFAIEIEGVSQP